MGSNTLSSLDKVKAAGTIIIADTADFNEIARFRPSEGTTNPSLLYAAAQLPAYAPLLQATAKHARSLSSLSLATRLERAVEFLAVQFGAAIYNATGGVATEVDVRHSFDTTATVAAALRLLALYEAAGVPRRAVRIKIAATWEGIQAGRILEQEHGVGVLITVVFGIVQAVAAAEAGVSCIAPYVGRIGDWYRARGEDKGVDRGVQEVRRMHAVLRARGSKTKIMGASFRNTEQVRHLAGIDLLTIAPGILEALEGERDGQEVVPVEDGVSDLTEVEAASYINDASAFHWAFNGDACAVEKSAEALRRFAQDTEKLKELLAALL